MPRTGREGLSNYAKQALAKAEAFERGHLTTEG
jgi:hypothetical protein